MVIFCEFFLLKDICEDIVSLNPWIYEFLSSAFVLILLLQKNMKYDYIFLSTFNERIQFIAYSIMYVYSYINF